MALVYKICPAADWSAAETIGRFTGSPVDHADGFIHLSAAHQVRETARRHFAGQEGLVLVALPEEALTLTWEPSRGGDLFPHVYGVIDPSAALWVRPLPIRDGAHEFPSEVPR
ncbi:DUF952 domain-containing protein [Aestuariivirga sp.]|uniref:DUF952 domain-containing protein n=1 Tax=Aestuariivirga sp. TaxID=2650926 RepID=UPI0039E5467D